MGQQSDGANRNIEDTVHSWRLAGVRRRVFALILALLSLAAPTALSQKSTGANAMQDAQKATVLLFRTSPRGR